MSKRISFNSVDFSEHPEMVQMDGHNLFALKYECKHAKLFAAYESIKRSLDYCTNSIHYINWHREKADEPSIGVNITAHHTAMITHYGRCFASGRVKLERGNVPKEYLKTHDTLVKLRNDYIAHSGGGGEAAVNIIGLYPCAEKKKILYVSQPILLSVNYINIELLQEAQNIISHLITYVKDKQKIHYEKILKEVFECNIDLLYAHFYKHNISAHEYKPEFSPGNYSFKVEVKPNGRVSIKGFIK